MGTSQADIFLGDNATVSGADAVSGGDGSDTLRLFGVNAAGVPTMTSIENLELHNVEPGDVDLTATAFSGVTSLTLDGFTASGENVTIKAGDVLVLSDVTGGGDVDIEAASTVTAATVQVVSSGASGAAVDLDVNGTGITTLNVDVSGATASFIDISELSSVTTVDIDASTAVTVAAIENAKTVDASGSTANVTLTSVAATDATVTGGSGDDSFGITLSSEDTINGGTGKDTLVLDQSVLVATGSLTSIEVVELSVSDGSVHSIDGDAFVGVTEYTASGTNFGSATSAFVDMASGNTYNIRVADAATATDDVTIVQKTDGTADTVTINLGTSSAAATLDELTANDAETVTLNIGSKDGHLINDLNVTDAKSVVVTGAGNAGITNIDTAADSTFDASLATSDLTLSFADNGNETIKTGSGDDAVTLAADSLTLNDVIDLGAGADTLNATSATFPTALDVKNVETIRLTLSGSDQTLAQTIDFNTVSGMTSLRFDGQANTVLAGALSLNRIGSGVTVELDAVGHADSTAETITLDFAAGVTTATVHGDELGDSAANDVNLTVDSAITTLNLASKSISDSTDEDDVHIETLTAAGATILNLSVLADGGAITIDSLATAALTALNISNSAADVAITIAGGTTDNDLATITASGVNTGTAGQGDVILGSATSILDRSDTAVITLGAGDDTLSFDITQHMANVIDMGINSTTSTSEAGDVLVVGGNMTGNITVDLSSTTDQLTLINGTSNTAVQKGLESFDGAGVTYVAGAFTVTGSSVANHITTDDGVDVINAGGGNNVITGGAGNDLISVDTAGNTVNTFVFGSSAALNGSDTITGFEAGTAVTDGDILDFTAFVTGRLIDADGSANTGTTAVTEFSTSATGEVDIAGKVVVFANGGTALTATSLAQEFADGTGSGNTAAFQDKDTAIKAIVIEGNAAGGAGAKIFFVDSTLDGTATDVTANDIFLVGTLATNIDIDALTGNQIL